MPTSWGCTGGGRDKRKTAIKRGGTSVEGRTREHVLIITTRQTTTHAHVSELSPLDRGILWKRSEGRHYILFHVFPVYSPIITHTCVDGRGDKRRDRFIARRCGPLLFTCASPATIAVRVYKWQYCRRAALKSRGRSGDIFLFFFSFSFFPLLRHRRLRFGGRRQERVSGRRGSARQGGKA